MLKNMGFVMLTGAVMAVFFSPIYIEAELPIKKECIKKEKEVKSKNSKDKNQKIGMFLMSKGFESELIWKALKQTQD